jgi:hypothetical protein
MEEIFTTKSETPINGYRKKNNTQIVSSLRTETETDNNLNHTDISQLLKNTMNTTNTTNTTTNTNTIPSKEETKKNGIINLQEDIVSIAESIHNLVKMIDEQREKMNFLEKAISKIGTIENEITKINENVKNATELTKQKNKVDDTESESYCDTTTTTSATTMSEKNKKNKNIILCKNKISSLKSQSKTETISDSCVSDSVSVCGYNNSKEVEEKLNNITKGINSELLDMKRKQALLAASYVKINKIR